MDNKKLIGKLENEISKRDFSYLKVGLEHPFSEKIFKAHSILLKLYDLQGNFSKSLNHYLKAVSELDKYSENDFSKQISFKDYEEYSKKKNSFDKKMNSYEKNLDEFKNKNLFNLRIKKKNLFDFSNQKNLESSYFF
jgi:tetratricopeptide (TPR) repeat protein